MVEKMNREELKEQRENIRYKIGKLNSYLENYDITEAHKNHIEEMKNKIWKEHDEINKKIQDLKWRV